MGANEELAEVVGLFATALKLTPRSERSVVGSVVDSASVGSVNPVLESSYVPPAVGSCPIPLPAILRTPRMYWFNWLLIGARPYMVT